MKKVLDHVGGEDVEETKGDFAYVGHHTICVLLRKAIMFIAIEIAGYLPSAPSNVMSYEEATFWLVVCFFNCYLNQEK